MIFEIHQPLYVISNYNLYFSEVDKVLFYSTIHEIRRYVPRQKDYMGVISQSTRITALDIDNKRKLLYWTDDTNRCTFKVIYHTIIHHECVNEIGLSPP